MNYLIIIAAIFVVIFAFRYFMLKKVKKKIGKEVNVALFDSGSRKLLLKEKSIIYFYSHSCSNCKVQQPIIDKLEKETNAVCKIDISKHPEISSEFGIMGVPTIAIMNKNRITNMFVGRQSETVLRTAYYEF